MRIAVLMGGTSEEKEISFLSGNAVLQSLKDQGYDAFAFDPSINNIAELKSQADVAFICLHGGSGEDGTVQGALESLGIPYTGCDVHSSALCFDKLLTKLLWMQMDISTPDGLVLSRTEFQDMIEEYEGDKNSLVLDVDVVYPCIVKPNRSGSSIGVNKVETPEGLVTAIEEAFQYSPKVLIEEVILGCEFAVTVINGAVYDIIKIMAPEGNYNLENKYYTDDTEYQYPYHFEDEDMEQQIIESAIRTYQEFGCSGAIRIDFMTNDDETKFFFLEVNTIPGMTSHSLIPKAVESHGINFDQLCKIILNEATESK
jgi:D-alanine-D-alanine ligase